MNLADLPSALNDGHTSESTLLPRFCLVSFTGNRHLQFLDVNLGG